MKLLAQLLGTGILFANILARVSPLVPGVRALGSVSAIFVEPQVILTVHSSMLFIPLILPQNIEPYFCRHKFTLKVFVAFGLGTIIGYVSSFRVAKILSNQCRYRTVLFIPVPHLL